MNALPSIKELAAREAERARHLLTMDGVIKKPSRPAPPLIYRQFNCKRCSKPYRTRYRTRPKIYCKSCRDREKQETADYKVVHRRDLRAAKAIVAGRFPGRVGRPRLAMAGAKGQG